MSTYTVLGAVGYLMANVLGIVLASCWELTLADRLVVFFAPPLAFIVVVTASRIVLGKERIVFYQTAVAGVASVVLLSWLAGAHIARDVDVTVVGIGTFLVFGRLGCLSVACCHGRPSRAGVVYGRAHVDAGLWSRWSERPLWPIQLVEAAASAGLVLFALVAGWRTPGVPTLVYAVGYATCRFVFELVRGDAARPQAWGLSEAQLTSVGTLVACAIWQPAPVTVALAAGVALVGLGLSLTRERRELLAAGHLHELGRLCSQLEHTEEGARRETRHVVTVSTHRLPDGRRDWVMSSTHPAWSPASAARIAQLLWRDQQLVVGRIPGVVHVITIE